LLSSLLPSQLPPAAGRSDGNRTTRQLVAVSFAITPLAHASSGAPLWAVAIAVVVVALALFLMFGPSWSRRPFSRARATDPVGPGVEPGEREKPAGDQ
jgi:hypothetical protein